MKKIVYILALFAGIIATISFLNLDVKLSSLFYHNGWTFSNNPLWMFFYKKGEYLPNLCGVVSAFILLLGYLWRRVFARYRRKCAFMVLLLIIAPTLITQTLKVTWGRPRPVEIKQFGGTHEFREIYQPNFKLAGNKNVGNSFPGGHASIGFYMIFLYYFTKRRWVFGLGALYGGLMGMARIVQGGHFLSDIVTSFFIVYITAELLNMFILKDHKRSHQA